MTRSDRIEPAAISLCTVARRSSATRFANRSLLRGQTRVSAIDNPRCTRAGQAAPRDSTVKAQCAACHGDALEGTVGPPAGGR